MSVSPKKERELLERMKLLKVSEEDIEEKFIRSSGPGGQKTNKTSTCVSLRHVPTDIIVKCQKERSQPLNRFFARRLLLDQIELKQKGFVAEDKKRIEKIRQKKRRSAKRSKGKMMVVLFCVLFSYSPFLNSGGMSSTTFAGEGIEAAEEVYALQRKRMVERQIIARGVKDKKVLETMENVPRHLFVPEKFRKYSYYDQPLPIGLAQTISQPYIVALMTEMLNVDDNDVVLEIGTGSGYQAAVLSEIVKEVYTIEIIEELGLQAKERLEKLGYNNVNARIADGYLGWPDKAPFDAIIVTAAAKEIPGPLLEQLKPGGRMVIPVDSSFIGQDLLLVEKDKKGVISTRKTIPVRFVPLVEGERTSK